MNFTQAWSLMKQGKKVKREHWGGYWSLENGEIIIHSKNGEITNIRNTRNVVGTFNNIAASDWILFKTVFISQPMDEKSATDISRALEIVVKRQDAIDKAKEMLGEDIVVAYSLLAVDVIFFAKGWENDTRCVIEHECAEKYGIQIVEELS